jgi:hypothetical protein
MPVGGRPERKLWLRRIGWLALIWATSVISLGIVAVLMRVLMEFAGLTNPRIVGIPATSFGRGYLLVGMILRQRAPNDLTSDHRSCCAIAGPPNSVPGADA